MASQPEAQDLSDLHNAVAAFVEERDWAQFHTPKNLSMALTVEASELLEQFQWLTPEASQQIDGDKRIAVEDEMADVFVYLIRMAQVLDVDLVATTFRKLEKTALKYPADLVRGSAAKYTQYQQQDPE